VEWRLTLGALGRPPALMQQFSWVRNKVLLE
jgi:hypothetical protein